MNFARFATQADPDALARAVFHELARIAEGLGVPVLRSDVPRRLHSADAIYVRATRLVPAHIVVDVALRGVAAAQALAHELAHAVLHADVVATSPLQEVEAEVSAFAVLRFLGLDTLSSTLAYVSQWVGSDEDLQQASPRVADACTAILARRLPVRHEN